jgi:AcrR family transcriptional regulator
MPRSASQNKALRDLKKGKILAKALRLFAMKGFDQVTVDDIMSDAGCAHGLFYHYFSSKEDVFNALVKIKEEKYKDFLIPQEEAMRLGGFKGLKLILEYCDHVIAGPDEAIYFCRISTTRHYTVTNYNEALLGEDYFPKLVQLIQQGQKEGQVRAGDPREIANMFIDFANGAMYRRIVEGGEKFYPIPSESIMLIFKK